MPETVNLIATAAEPSFEVLAKAVDDAAARVARLAEEPRRAAEELRAAVEAVHKAALVTIVATLRASDEGRALLYEFVDDPLIRMIFSLHAIIRTDTPPGVGAAGEHAAGSQPGHAQSGCGCGHGIPEPHGVPRHSPTIIPLSAIGRRGALDIWPGGAS